MADVQLLTDDQRALASFAGWWSRLNGSLLLTVAVVTHLLAVIIVAALTPPTAVALLGGLAAGSVTVAAGVMHFGTPGRFLRRGR